MRTECYKCVKSRVFTNILLFSLQCKMVGDQGYLRMRDMDKILEFRFKEARPGQEGGLDGF